MDLDRQDTRVQGVAFWIALATLFGHAFCCGLPLLFGLLSLLTGFGFFSAMFPGFEAVHGALHNFEMPLMVLSASLLVFGWAVHLHAEKVDCHDTGCHHPPCTPRKAGTAKILIVASVIFAVNLILFATGEAHRGAASDHAHDPAVHEIGTNQ